MVGGGETGLRGWVDEKYIEFDVDLRYEREGGVCVGVEGGG